MIESRPGAEDSPTLDATTLEALEFWKAADRDDQKRSINMALDVADKLTALSEGDDEDWRSRAGCLAVVIVSVGVGICASQVPGLEEEMS